MKNDEFHLPRLRGTTNVGLLLKQPNGRIISTDDEAKLPPDKHNPKS